MKAAGALLTREDAERFEGRPGPEPEATTALIAAAGRGSRLGYHLPKVLYPVDGRPLIAWLVERLTGLVGRVALVLSPEGASAVDGADLELALPITTAVQSSPTGMADAVLAAEETIRASACGALVILWGDQIGVQRETIARALAVHAHHPLGPAVTIPLARVDAPYVHYAFDTAGSLTGVAQRREGDALPDVGLADCGCFVVSPSVVFPILHRLRSSDLLYGRLSHEQNFLQAFPFLAREVPVVCFEGASPADTIGLNSAVDLERLTRVTDVSRRGTAR
jgi:bifunctional N-acetylglucosamine-1-phosphate-uridyltransferase/glucosamine-1-phosphate-acetyltransferase GlmU-like protein